MTSTGHEYFERRELTDLPVLENILFHKEGLIFFQAWSRALKQNVVWLLNTIPRTITRRMPTYWTWLAVSSDQTNIIQDELVASIRVVENHTQVYPTLRISQEW